MRKTAKLFICTVLLLILTFAFTACGKTTVDVADFVTVTYDSYNTMGSAKVNIDYTGLNSLVDTETVNKYMSNFPDGQQSIAWGYTFNFAELLDIKLKENYSELSNGDKIVVEISLISDLVSAGETMESMQKALKITIPVTELEFTVSGLQEAKILDVVGIAAKYIAYTGANGGATAEVCLPDGVVYETDGLIFKRAHNYASTLNVVYNNQNMGSFVFFCEDAENLSNGSSFELYCRNYTNLGQTDYDIVKETMNVTVSGLGEYVTSKDLLTDEIKTQAVTTLNEIFANETNPQIHSYYWGKLKKTAVSDSPVADAEKLFAIVQYDGFLGTKTFRCEAEIIKNPDNTYSVTWNPVQVYSQETLHNKNYDIEKIEF